MSDLVRVRENGVEHNEGRARAIAKGLEVLDEPTHVNGNARKAIRVGGRPVKPRKRLKKATPKTSPTPTEASEETKAAVTESAPEVEENR